MSVLSVTIPVPVSGDGALASVASLVGQKTVQLAGLFAGSYVLLGSHDDANFVPVVAFDAGGEASIEQTVSGAFKSFKLRALGAPVSGSTLTCTVTGTSGVGENKFAVVASLAAGSGGASAPVDTYALFPLTGLEEEICYVCRGGYVGSLVVEGRPDPASAWNPIVAFRVDRRPQGSPAVVELPVAVTKDQIRYLRVNLDGVATAATTVTVGGRIPSTASSGSAALALDDSTGRSTTLAAAGEEILYEEPVDLDSLPANITPTLAIVAKVSSASAGTVRAYLGSTTPGDTTGGTVRATIATSSLTEVLLENAGSAFVNPGGRVLLQITAVNDTPATCATEIFSFSLNLE